MDYYLYIKAFHVMAFTAWMAMLFYLPRLFVYHAENRHNAEFVSVVEIQERKLYLYIGLPSVMATLISGLIMIWLNPVVFSGGWLHAKLMLVFLLLLFHGYCGVLVNSLRNKTCNKSGRFFRVLNEFPTIVLILVVFLAIVRPF